MSDELKVSNCSRKRVREVKRNSEPVNYGASAWNALNLINRFNELSLFKENEERINDKDTLCQDFIDRFEKLYKPAAIGEDKALAKWPIEPYNKDSEKCSVKFKLKYRHADYASTTKDDCPMYILRTKLLDDYSFPGNLRTVLLKYGFKNRRPPYGWYADIIMGKAVIEADSFGTRAGNKLVYGVDNFISDFYATVGWTRIPQQISMKAITYESDNDSDYSNAAKQRKRRKLRSNLVQ